MILAVYADDTTLASNDDEMLKSEKAKLSDRFEMEDQGPIHYCLGMSVKRDKEAKVLSISQKAYLENVLQWFGMYDANLCPLQWNQGRNSDKLPGDQHPVKIQRYQAAIGSLMYASIATRSDISSAVGVLSQLMSRPGPEQWSGIKRVFRYIKGTLDFHWSEVCCFR